MKTYTEQEICDILIPFTNAGMEVLTDDFECNEIGQLVVYTNIFKWTDGSYHDQAE